MIMEKKYVDYLLLLMKELLDIPSVSGSTEAAMKRVGREFDALGIKTHMTNKGAIYGTIPGKDDEHQRLVNAHIDTLGAIVSEILPSGRLRLSQIGGYSWNTYEGENLSIHTGSGKIISGSMMYEKSSVHTFPEEARHKDRVDENMEVRIDADVYSAQDAVELGIGVGDFVSFEPRCVILDNGYIKSRYIDDKSCVALMFAAMKYIRENKIVPSCTTHFYVANYEEIGHGISYIPEKTNEMLSLDIGTVGIGRNSDEHCVTIIAKDSRTPYDVGFRRRLENMAKAEGISYRVDVPNRYGSDASLCVIRGADVNFACIGPGTDASHHYERTHMDALINSMKLLLAYLQE